MSKMHCVDVRIGRFPLVVEKTYQFFDKNDANDFAVAAEEYGDVRVITTYVSYLDSYNSALNDLNKLVKAYENG